MAKLIDLNFKRSVNVFTQGNPERAWPHVLQTVGISKIPILDFNYANMPQLDSRVSWARNTTATCMAYASGAVSGDSPVLTTVAANLPRFTNARYIGSGVWSNVLSDGTPILLPITLLCEEARTNLLLNSAIPATQNITTTAQSYTISMWGTGTCTLSGTATGVLTGTDATARTPLTVTATAGTLTLTFSGTNTNGQAEAGASMSSYIPTAAAAVTRLADVPSMTGAGLNWYNSQQGTFVIKASGQYSSAPANIGVWNPLLTGEGTYVIRYNKSIDNSAYLYLPNAAAGVNPVEYQDIPTPTTILLAEQGIINISSWKYYDKDLSNAIALALVNGTLTTAFDVSYAATTNFTSLFAVTAYMFANRVKYFPKINTSSGTNFTAAWDGESLRGGAFPKIDVSKGTAFNFAWRGNTAMSSFLPTNFSEALDMTAAFRTLTAGITAMPVGITFPKCTTFNVTWENCSALATFPPNVFDNSKSKIYTSAFNGCALTQTSVDNILVSIAQSVVNTPTLTNGTLNMTGGTSATPSATGLAAKAALVAAGWTVTNN
jgi:hypothetical protein